MLSEFSAIYNSKTFVDGLHSVKRMKTNHNKSSTFHKQKVFIEIL